MGTRTLGQGDIHILGRGMQDGLQALQLQGVIGTLDGRVRVAQGITQHSTKHLFDSLPQFFDDAQVSGTGTSSTHDGDRASVTLSVSDSTAGRRVRQTFVRYDYEPNKTSLYSSSFILGGRVPGVTKRIGLFDDNNGVFLEQTGDGEFWVIRSSTSGSPVDDRIPLSESNENRSAALNIDFTKIQNVNIFFNWYGAGECVFAMQQGEAVEFLHRVRHDNIFDVVWMSTPQLPIRFEIENDGTGGAASMETVAQALIIEGSSPDDGIPFAASRGTTAITPGTTGDWYPVISTRARADYLSRQALPTGATIVLDGSGIYEVGLFRNPTVAGTDNASWQQYTGAAIEYDISRTTANTLTGTPLEIATIESGFFAGGMIDLSFSRLVSYGSFIDDTPVEVVLAVRLLNTTGIDVYGSFNWSEFI